MLAKGFFGLLKLTEVPYRAVFFPLMGELLDTSGAHQFGKQCHNIHVIGWENPHLEGDRLPLENALIVALGPYAGEKDPGRH